MAVKGYNVKELAEKLSVGDRTIRNIIKSGELKAKKVGRAWISTEEWVKEYMEKED